MGDTVLSSHGKLRMERCPGVCHKNKTKQQTENQFQTCREDREKTVFGVGWVCSEEELVLGGSLLWRSNARESWLGHPKSQAERIRLYSKG